MGNAPGAPNNVASTAKRSLHLNLTESLRTGDGPIELLRHGGNRNHAAEQKQLNAMKKTFKRCTKTERNEVSIHELLRYLSLLHVF